MAKHKWYLCGMCGPTILCGTCGNNACNAGIGKLPNGEDCPDCESSWKLQEEFVETEAGKVYNDYAAKLHNESMSHRRYWDNIEFYLRNNHPEVLKEMWLALDADDPSARQEGSRENQKYFESHP